MGHLYHPTGVRSATLRTLLVLFLLATGGAEAGAQTPAPSTQRPYRGLFAPTDSDGRRFDLLWSMAGVYDDNVSTEMPGYDPQLRLGGGYGLAAATLNYSVKGRKTTFAATSRTNARYYPNLSDLNVVDGSGGLTLATDLTRRLRLSVAQSLSYLPYYQFAFLNGVAPSQPVEAERIPTTTSSAMRTVGSISADGRVQLVQNVGRRASLSADYSYRYSKLDNSPDVFLWQFGNTRFTKPITRYASLRLGYGYGVTSNGSAVPSPDAQDAIATSRSVETQNIDAGLAYTKPLSQSRRTYVSFSSGTSAVAYAGTRQFVFLSNAGLTHNFGESWNANLTYDRGVQFVEGIAGPLYADTVQLRLGGLVARSIELAVASSYSNGQIGLGGTDPGYDTYSGFATLRFAFSRGLSLEAQYRYSRYLFDAGAPLLPGLPQAMEQQGLRVGITGWLPFLRP